jgi:hypothetical protein
MTDYGNSLRKQLANSDKPGINEYLTHLYRLISDEVSKSGQILEVGAGAGISKKFLKNQKVFRTDFFDFPENDVKGEIDTHALPFEDRSYSSSIAIDVLHHLKSPITSLSEMKRVTNLKSGGSIVLIEPYVSFFSYPVYRIFHTERTSNPWVAQYSEPFSSDWPGDGNQSLSRLLFTKRTGRKLLSTVFPAELYSVELYVFSVFSFFITGGLSRPLPLPRIIVSLTFQLERHIPQILLRFLGSRCLIVIKEKL